MVVNEYMGKRIYGLRHRSCMRSTKMQISLRIRIFVCLGNTQHFHTDMEIE